ncbi:MAG: phosphate ABC transporter permease PstA [Alphaproteobacteria bacterium]|nr:phosphate ABC transporter permease PstA [Alphaproteobacteria bacterium]
MSAAEAPPAARETFTAPENLERRKFADSTFVFWGLLATTIGLAVLASLVTGLFLRAQGKLTPEFFLSFPSPDAATAGILSAWVGSILVIVTTALIAIPLGVMAAIYLEEYAPKNPVTDVIEITVNNLAGVPSIVYGLLGLGLFVYQFKMGQTVLTAGLTLALLILPVIIVATREAVRGVPQGIREAALSVGATKWQTTSHHVLPYATPGVVTGVIIGLSRALGETAPLIVIGVPTFVAFLPFIGPGDVGMPVYDEAGNEHILTSGDMLASWMPFGDQGWLNQLFTVMPMQMFNWTGRPEAEFQQNAAAAGIVLLIITLLLNGTAIWLRYRMRKKIRW